MGIYYQHIDVTDFGPYVTKLVLALPAKVQAENIKPDQFSVYVKILDKNGQVAMLPKSFLERDNLVPSEAYRVITDAYPCTLGGSRQEEGTYLALEMKYGPMYPCSSAIASNPKSINGHGYYMISDYTITQVAPIKTDGEPLKGLVFDHCAGARNPKREQYRLGASSNGMRYGYYIPKLSAGGKHPLIIFLHGAGEGGLDTAIAFTGNKVTAFAEPYAQEIFGGAFVLVPQCDTMWLDDGSHAYGDSGKSMYVKDLKQTIDEFIADYAGVIDKKRIYVGGDSNGGFMTMRMMMDYPRFFAAGFPICEAMLDKRIRKRDIENLAKIPIWFTHAKNDPVVKPDQYVVPTYERIIAAGAKNCHFTFWDKIIDRYAGWDTPDGKPMEYFGHFAWIPMLNDDCKLDYDGKPVLLDGEPTTIFRWMAAQKKS